MAKVRIIVGNIVGVSVVSASDDLATVLDNVVADRITATETDATVTADVVSATAIVAAGQSDLTVEVDDTTITTQGLLHDLMVKAESYLRESLGF